MSINKRLLFGSLAIAAVVVVAVSAVAAGRDDSNTHVAEDDDFTLTSSNDLSPTIGTNAAVTGEAFPAVDVQTLLGDSFPTADLVGRPLVVNFWYSTCAPCKKELPGFAEVHAKLGDQVRFVGVDTLSPSDTEEAFARDKGVQYELLYDPDGELTSAVGVAAFPQTLFIDSQGTILKQTGELTEEKLEELIRTTLL
ncbi:MAG: TlpA disulfide reductase family protein [Ilumatobacteraceae bacterium]